jgi:hypothetical protein
MSGTGATRIHKLAGSSKRALPLLRALEESHEGLTLMEALAALGEAGHSARCLVVRELKKMRLRGWVDYGPDADHQGSPRGIYTMTLAGARWLEQERARSVVLPPPEIPTGAMRGEMACVVRTIALPGQAPRGIARSVFDLRHHV